MKKMFRISMALIAACVMMLGAESCKKKKDDSPRAKLLGKWKLAQVGIDANSNLTVDADEVTALPDTFAIYAAFGGDGSGTISMSVFGTEMSNGFEWELVNNNAYLVMKSSQTNPMMPATDASLHIKSLTESELVVRDTTSSDSTGMASWMIFSKQK